MKNNPNKIVFLLVASLIFLCFSGCNKDPVELPASGYAHFPIGMKSITGTDFEIQADSIIKDYQLIEDGFGGRWIKIAFNKFDLKTRVKIRFVKKAGPLVLTKQQMPVPDVFTKPSLYIDSDNELIIQKSKELAFGFDDHIAIAKNIQQFIVSNFEHLEYQNHVIHPASVTIQNNYGTSVNFTRLFVALCRAAGIPARSVWGTVYEDGSFNYHKNWAEVLDEDGFWHPLDLFTTTTFDLNDIRYLDLVYSTEENGHFEHYKTHTKDANGDYFYYDGSIDGIDGKLSIDILTNNYPDSLELSMYYKIDKLFDN